MHFASFPTKVNYLYDVSIGKNLSNSTNSWHNVISFSVKENWSCSYIFDETLLHRSNIIFPYTNYRPVLFCSLQNLENPIQLLSRFVGNRYGWNTVGDFWPWTSPCVNMFWLRNTVGPCSTSVIHFKQWNKERDEKARKVKASIKEETRRDKAPFTSCDVPMGTTAFVYAGSDFRFCPPWWSTSTASN